MALIFACSRSSFFLVEIVSSLVKRSQLAQLVARIIKAGTKWELAALTLPVDKDTVKGCLPVARSRLVLAPVKVLFDFLKGFFHGSASICFRSFVTGL